MRKLPWAAVVLFYISSSLLGGRVYGQTPIVDTLDIPFFDDFSGPFDAPYKGYWIRQADVDCGQQVAINPPTVGAAIFDALRADGAFHAQKGAGGNACDTLMSKSIRLRGTDSVYLSFQIQPQGWGGQPQPGDVLTVDFFDPRKREWNEVWRASYDASKQRLTQQYLYPKGKEKEVSRMSPSLASQFSKAHIPVVGSYNTRGFQFRFRNTVIVPNDTQMPGRNSNTGHWAVDLVYVNAGRTFADTLYIDDEAMLSGLAGIDLPYQSIPYVLAKPWLDELGQNPNKELIVRYVNLDTKERTVGREYRIKDATNTLPIVGSSRALFQPLGSLSTEEYRRTYSYSWGALAEQELDVTLEANLKVNVAAHLRPFLWNDTVRRRLHFADAYAYDTGVPDNGYGIDGLATSKACAAMRFVPIGDGTIEKIRIFFNPIVDLSTRARFEIVIWNERNGLPGDELYAQRCTPPETFNKKAPFIEYTLDRPIGFSEPLYVGWRQTKADMMQVGIDLHTSTPSKIVYNAVGAWEPSQYRGALMIRLVCSAGGETPVVSGCADAPIVTLRVYPNPARERVFVQGVPLGSEVQLYTMQGQLVKAAEALGGAVEMNVANLAGGAYLLVVKGPHGEVQASERLIVQ